MNSVKYRAYVKGTLKAETPFLTKGIESPSDDETDMIALRDESGHPFLPGSSLAGVLRNIFQESEYTTQMFGPLLSKKANETMAHQSCLITYDCFLSDQCVPELTLRDGIRLRNDSKVTEKHAKYDYEVIEPGAGFDFKIELVIRDHIYNNKNKYDNMRHLFNLLIEQMRKGFYLGIKTNRGLGRFVLIDPLIYEICGDDAYKRYVEFDWKQSSFSVFDSVKLNETDKLGIVNKMKEWIVPINFTSTLLIRDYIGNRIKTLTSAGEPVIPGTSWSGLFRHECRRTLLELDCDECRADELIDEMFGTRAELMIEHKNKQASRVAFSETRIEEGRQFKQTHVKIDRFTQGATDSALFDEEIVALGKTSLIIRYTDEWMRDLLSLVMADLKDGLTAIGGQTAIGRGLCEPDIELDECCALIKKLSEEGQICSRVE